MKHNQLIALVLVLTTLLSGCSSLVTEHHTDRDRDESSEIHIDSLFDTDYFNRPDIDTSRISYASPFSEGLAFIQLDKSPEHTYCINKKGEIVFTLTGDYSPAIGFHNGIATINKNSGPYRDILYLCDTSGKITCAEDLGATYFQFDRKEIFAGGFIFVVEETKAERDTICALGILDSNLKYIVEPSESLYELYWDSYQDDDKIAYYGGYLFKHGEWTSSGRYLDLRTGQENTGLDALFSKIKLSHKSDFWCSYRDQKGIYFYDQRFPEDSESILVGPIECNGTFAMPLTFRNGTAAFQYVLGTPGNSAGYFTLIGENGKFLFKPVKTNMPYPEVISDHDMHLVISARNSSYKNKCITLQLFDRDGLVGELQYSISMFTPKVSFSDGVIQILDENDQYAFYGTDLEPLF